MAGSAAEEDYAELMAAGDLPQTQVMEIPGEDDGVGALASRDTGEINTADLADEIVSAEE